MSIVEGLNERGTGRLPGLIGLDVLEAEERRLATRLELRDELLAPNGYLHAATIVALACEARLAHDGRTTQVWDATVADDDSGKPLALFRCTQLILYPR